MTRFEVPEPAACPTGPHVLGRLGHALARVAAAQGLAVPELQRVATVAAGPGQVDDGVALADRLVDEGTRLLVVSGGHSTGADTVVAALLDLEPVAVVGTAPGPGWADALVGVRTGLAAARAHVGDPARLLTAAGEPGLLVGVLAQAAVRRTPLLLDGSPQVAAALLVADRLAPGVAAWCTAATVPVSPGAAAALHDLDLEPLLDLGLADRGAELALVLLRAAVTSG